MNTHTTPSPARSPQPCPGPPVPGLSCPGTPPDVATSALLQLLSSQPQGQEAQAHTNMWFGKRFDLFSSHSTRFAVAITGSAPRGDLGQQDRSQQRLLSCR